MTQLTDPFTEKSISRRSVVKGIAWATPVVAMATATPAYAAWSPGCFKGIAWVSSDPGTATGNVGARWRTYTIKIRVPVDRPGCTISVSKISLAFDTWSGASALRGTATITPALPATAAPGGQEFTIVQSVNARYTIPLIAEWPYQVTVVVTVNDGLSASLTHAV